MANERLRKAISAEVLAEGILITFGNGDEGLYSEELLRASLPGAQTLLARLLRQPEDGEPPL